MSFDASGNLYGTTVEGGSSGLGLGVVYRLSPNPEPPWNETVLHKFEGEGNPYSTVSFDSLGNMYGTFTDVGGVFRITPQGGYRQLLFGAPPGPSIPYAGVFVYGKALYGTTAAGGTQDLGSVFQVDGTTTAVLYSFCSQPACSDGSLPQGALVARNGSLYGTTTRGGANGEGGVVFQISSSAPRPGSKAHRTRGSNREGLSQFTTKGREY